MCRIFSPRFSILSLVLGLVLEGDPVAAGLWSWLNDPSPDLVKAVKAVVVKPPDGLNPTSKAAITYVYWNTAVAYVDAYWATGGGQENEWKYLGNAIIHLPVQGVDQEAVAGVLQSGKLWLDWAELTDSINLHSAATPGYLRIGTAIVDLMAKAPAMRQTGKRLEIELAITSQTLSSRYGQNFREFRLNGRRPAR